MKKTGKTPEKLQNSAEFQNPKDSEICRNRVPATSAICRNSVSATENAAKKEKKEKTVKEFEISGTFREGKHEKKFTKSIGAFNENFAKEKLMAAIGSKHGTKRRDIRIGSCGESKGDAGKKGK